MKDLTDKILEYGNKRKERVIGRYNISELWGLLTINSHTGKPYTSIQEWLDEEKRTFTECFKMWQGEWKHKQIQDLLPDWEIEKKIEYKHKDFVLVGKADAIQKDTILEIKTSDKIIPEAKRWHIWQVSMYLSMFKKEKGVIVQPTITNSKLFLREIGIVERDDKWFEKELLKIDDLHKKLKEIIKSPPQLINKDL